MILSNFSLAHNVNKDKKSTNNKLLSTLLEESKNFTFPDNPECNFASALNNEIKDSEFSPFSNNGKSKGLYLKYTNVLVIGAGASGLLTAYQLLKYGMNVSVAEADKRPDENFKKSGRLYEVTIDKETNSTVQLGAMRFPNKSQLFWHYYKIFTHPNDDPELSPFPNPGLSPSILFAKNLKIRDEIGYLQGSLNLPNEITKITNKHILTFFNLKPSGSEKTLSEISALLEKSNLNPEEILSVKIFMQGLSNEYEITYRDFLKKNNFSEEEIRIIGDVGFGTGGFEPLFKISFVDIARLVMWDYSEEFSVPDQSDLPKNMISEIEKLMNGGKIQFEKPVKGVFYDLGLDEYLVYYENQDLPEKYDHIICAMTHTAAVSLLQSSNSMRHNLKSRFIVPFADERAGNYLPSQIYSEMIQQEDINASKIFHSTNGPTIASNYPYLEIKNLPKMHISAVYGDTLDIGNRYLLPLKDQDLSTSSKCIALHYGWENIAIDVKNEFSDYFNDGLMSFSYDNKITQEINKIINTRISDTYLTFNWNKDPSIKGDDFSYFSKLASTNLDLKIGNIQAIYWNDVKFIWCGFKLDKPGIGNSMVWNAINRALFVSTDNGEVGPDLKLWDSDIYSTQHQGVSRFYFCGDSFSHYGGWVEGAFQSSIFCCAGVLMNYTKDNDKDFDLNKNFIRSIVLGMPIKNHKGI